jgi:hypothetical protein
VELPQTLHGQLYLLAYDRERHRVSEYRPLFGLALSAAMLTDLYLTGCLDDKGGKPCPSRVACPDDPLLRAAFRRIGFSRVWDWAALIAQNEQRATEAVCDQLQATG